MKYRLNFKLLGNAGLSRLNLILMLLLFLSSCGMASSPSLRVGGPCTYKQYKGEAEIVSVTPKQGIDGKYEIRFSFQPRETVKEDFASIEGKQWLLVRKDSSYPKGDFIIQYDIKTGKRFPCNMKVIIRGTCTPVLFDFPTIRNGKAQ